MSISENFEAVIRRLDHEIDRARAREAELAEQRFEGRSPRGWVRAIVDGQGRLLDLVIDPAALRSSHPAGIGPETVAAVGAARATASREISLQMAAARAAGAAGQESRR